MAVKFKLKPNPTFKAPVGLYQHGSDVPTDVLFEFKHRTLDGYDEWRKSIVGRANAEALMESVIGWELEDEFSLENFDLLLQSYGAAFGAILDAYVRELVQARRKN